MAVRPQAGPQESFLASPADIAIYGGAAGGGKTWALLMEPLRHVANKDFGAVIFRRSTVQVRNQGGLWDESSTLYPNMGAEPREHVLDWRFPSGSTVAFAHLEHDKTVLNWQGSQIPLIGFDELTHFSPNQFWYMVSRNRSTCGVRPYIRATCNPDADSWVAEFISWWIDPVTGVAIPERGGKLRWFVRINDKLIWADSPDELAEYVDAAGKPIPAKSVTFVPAKLSDNSALMAADPGYLANLMALPTVERERLLGGNWKIKNTQALVFTNWSVREFDTPADAQLRLGADWGFANDPTVLVGGFIGRWENGKAVADPGGRVLFVDREAHGVEVEIDDTPALFDTVEGSRQWTITADSARPETVSAMRRYGFRIIPAIKGPGSIEDGIKFLQNFEIVLHPRVSLIAREMSRYSYRVDRLTGEIMPLLEDSNNNAIDALRYALEALRRTFKKQAPPPPKPRDRWDRVREEGNSWKTA